MKIDKEFVKEKIIFCILNSEGLPKWHLELSRVLSKSDICLVPIQFDQFLKLNKNLANIVVFWSETTFKERQWADTRLKRYLKGPMTRKNMTFIHVSSFYQFEEFRALSSLRIYNYIRLPVGVEKLAVIMSAIYNFVSLKSQKWPGGKRIPLPDI